MSQNKKLLDSSLKILGIYELSQLNEKDIDYWWMNMTRKIQNSPKENSKIVDLLIELNNARDYLNEYFSLSEIKDFLDSGEDIYHSDLEKKNEHKKSLQNQFTYNDKLNTNNAFIYSFKYKSNSINYWRYISIIFLFVLSIYFSFFLGLFILIFLIYYNIKFESSYIKISNKEITHKYLYQRKRFFNLEDIEKCTYCPNSHIVIKFKNNFKKPIILNIPEQYKNEILMNIEENLNLINK